MKTSNKLIIALAATIALTFIIFLVSLKANMVASENYTPSEDTAEPVLFMDDIQASTFHMDGNFKYQIDPNSTKLVMKGDSALISKLGTKREGDEIRIVWKDDVYYEGDFRMNIVYGTKGVENPQFIMSGNSQTRALDTIESNNLNIIMEGNATANIMTQNQTASISTSGNTRLNLEGITTNMTVNQSANSKIKATALDMDQMNINMTSNSYSEWERVKETSGTIRGNANLTIYANGNKTNINVIDNAKLNRG